MSSCARNDERVFVTGSRIWHRWSHADANMLLLPSSSLAKVRSVIMIIYFLSPLRHKCGLQVARFFGHHWHLAAALLFRPAFTLPSHASLTHSAVFILRSHGKASSVCLELDYNVRPSAGIRELVVAFRLVWSMEQSCCSGSYAEDMSMSKWSVGHRRPTASGQDGWRGQACHGPTSSEDDGGHRLR